MKYNAGVTETEESAYNVVRSLFPNREESEIREALAATNNSSLKAVQKLMPKVSYMRRAGGGNGNETNTRFPRTNTNTP